MRKIPSRGQSVCRENEESVINLYPHVAGNSFPEIANACGSISLGNIIPDSIVDGIKSRMENMEVFAVSFTANPMILAMLSRNGVWLQGIGGKAHPGA